MLCGLRMIGEDLSNIHNRVFFESRPNTENIKSEILSCSYETMTMASPATASNRQIS